MNYRLSAGGFVLSTVATLFPLSAAALRDVDIHLSTGEGELVNLVGKVTNTISELTQRRNNNFVPAITLEEFKNVDFEWFEWVNPNELEAGETTCGFLKAPLGALPNTMYPTVKVCK